MSEERDFLKQLADLLLHSWSAFWDEQARWAEEGRVLIVRNPTYPEDIEFASKKILDEFSGWYSDKLKDFERILDKHPDIKRGYMDDYGLKDATVLELVCVAADREWESSLEWDSDIPEPIFF